MKQSILYPSKRWMIAKKCRDYPKCYGKEQVIRFGFDFFKFAGSAAGTTETGFNDLTFKVSPLKGPMKSQVPKMKRPQLITSN